MAAAAESVPSDPDTPPKNDAELGSDKADGDENSGSDETLNLAALEYTEAERVPQDPFELSVQQLCSLLQPGEEASNKANLTNFGGAQGVAQALGSSIVDGVDGSEDALLLRRRVFSSNKLPGRPIHSFWSLLWEAFKDPVLQVLLVAAIVSFTIGVADPHEREEGGWIDAIAIWMAVVAVSVVGAANDYQKQRQFLALETSSVDEVKVKVIRNGTKMTVNSPDVVVGDILDLEAGDSVPADGICVYAESAKLSAASLTGESDELPCDPVEHPVVMSGMEVCQGSARILVCAVGERSMVGRIRKATTHDSKTTPLQEKLTQMVKWIGIAGAVLAGMTLVGMLIKLAAGAEEAVEAGTARWIIEAVIIAIVVVVVAIPEGLPLAVTLSLAYSTRNMMRDNNLVRVLAACETMGNATDICSDKTGTLTQNRMTIVQLWLPAPSVVDLRDKQPSIPCSREDSKIVPVIPKLTASLLTSSFTFNTTALLVAPPQGSGAVVPNVIGSKTAGAGLMLAAAMGSDPMASRKDAATRGIILKHHLFSSKRKLASVIVRLENDSSVAARVFITGAPEQIFSRCSHWLADGETATPFNEEAASHAQHDMASKALRTLAYAYKDIGKLEDLPGYVAPPSSMTDPAAIQHYYSETNQAWFEDPSVLEDTWLRDEDDEVKSDSDATGGFTLVAVAGIEDPLRPEVPESVKTCQRAGIRVRMVTGDNRDTAEAIAKQCNILTEGGLVLEGPAFRRMTAAQVDEILPRLQVLARASPDDKYWLVRRINGNLPSNKKEWERQHPGVEFSEELADKLQPGYGPSWEKLRYNAGTGRIVRPVVGVTGDGTNDAPALKAANVGLSMGIAGTDVARNASDIVILDDNFSSIVSAVKWGRCVYDSVCKFLQFQLSVNVVACSLIFLGAVIPGVESPLNPVQMLWVNLIMDSMGALALGTELPTDALLERKPYALHAPLISRKMIRHIAVQSVFQLALCLSILLVGVEVPRDFLSHDTHSVDEMETRYVSALVFNTFVFATLFNEINARSISDDWDVFSGMFRNRLFVGVILITAALQALIVEFGGDFTRTHGQSAKHWGLAIGYGAISLPLGILMRFIPVADNPKVYASYYSKDLVPVPLAVSVSKEEQSRKETVPSAKALHDAQPNGSASP